MCKVKAVDCQIRNAKGLWDDCQCFWSKTYGSDFLWNWKFAAKHAGGCYFVTAAARILGFNNQLVSFFFRLKMQMVSFCSSPLTSRMIYEEPRHSDQLMVPAAAPLAGDQVVWVFFFVVNINIQYWGASSASIGFASFQLLHGDLVETCNSSLPRGAWHDKQKIKCIENRWWKSLHILADVQIWLIELRFGVILLKWTTHCKVTVTLHNIS